MIRSACFLLAMVSSVTAFAAPADELRALLDDAAKWRFEGEPTMATFVGVPGYDDKLHHVTPADLAGRIAVAKKLRARLDAIPVQQLDERQRLWCDSLAFMLDSEMEMLASDLQLLAFSQIDGSHLSAQILAVQPHHTVAEIDAWNRRMGELPRVLDEEIAAQRRGIEKKIVPPRWSVEEVIQQVKAMSNAPALKRAYLGELADDLKSLPAAERKRLSNALDERVERQLVPAYTRLGKFLHDELLPHSRDTDGIWALPGGAGLYALAVRTATTTNMKPDELHAIGEKEVARLEAEMLAIARKRGFSDLAAYQKSLATDAAQHPKDGAALLAAYQRYSQAYLPLMAKQFGRLPKAGLEVVPIEDYRAENASGAEYKPGSPDGKRPGKTMVNTFKAQERVMWDVQPTAYHEGAPGHHLQLMIAMEDGDLPAVIRSMFVIAYIEGWALYAEALPKELGLYTDPSSDFGRLDSERLRAVRLVVDTGLHAKKWTREQARDYMRKHTALAETDLRSEVDRYVVWPGQALGYKVGQLKLRELRGRAEAKLGKRFDLRAFHDAVLIGGPRPMSALEAGIDRFIASHAR